MKRNTVSTKPFEKSNCFYFPIILNNCTRPPTPARLKGLGLIWFNLGFNQTYNHTSTNVGEMQQIVVQQTNHQRGRISFHSYDYSVMMMRQADGDADGDVPDADADDAFTVDDDVFSPETPFNHRKRYWTVKRY